MITNKNYNVDLANSDDRKIIYHFAKVMYFDEKAPGNKSNRDRSLIRLLKSPAWMISASGLSNTIFYQKILMNIDRLKLLLREKQAANNSDIINEENVAIVDELLEYNCISKKQLQILQLKCSN